MKKDKKSSENPLGEILAKAARQYPLDDTMVTKFSQMASIIMDVAWYAGKEGISQKHAYKLAEDRVFEILKYGAQISLPDGICEERLRGLSYVGMMSMSLKALYENFDNLAHLPLEVEE